MYIPYWLVIIVLIYLLLAVFENKRIADEQEKEIRNEFGAIAEWLLLKMLYLNNSKNFKEKYKEELLGDLYFHSLHKFYEEFLDRRLDVDLDLDFIPNFNAKFELKYRAEILPSLEKKYGERKQ